MKPTTRVILILFVPALATTTVSVAQNSLGVQFESIPSMNRNVRGTAILKNLSNSNTYTQESDSTGQAQFNIPNGTYELKSLVNQTAIKLDTLVIPSTNYFLAQMMENIPTGSTFHTTTVNAFQTETGTLPSFELTPYFKRWPTGNIRIFHGPNRPAYTVAKFDTVKADFFNKTRGTYDYFEEQTYSDTGIFVQYVHTNEMPVPARAFTRIDSLNGDGTIKRAKIWFNIDVSLTEADIIREMYRATGAATFSLDPSWVGYWQGTNVTRLQPIEGSILEMMIKFANGINARHFQDTVYTTGVKIDEPLPESYSLSQNYPNPFNPSTTITYSLPSISNVTITVYNTLGQQVRTLVNEREEPGTYQTTFNAEGLASGVYLVRLNAVSATRSVSITRSMVFIK